MSKKINQNTTQANPEKPLKVKEASPVFGFLPSAATLNSFATAIMDWQKIHGRHGLPWQANKDPYRVWLSEVMLQQTQVATVIPYFEKFTQQFPTVTDLANAHLDEVLGLWSGLGYYSRARNLHRCAQAVVKDWAGQFPNNAQDLQQLPGIGRSTASAIAATCFGQRVTILDGNAKRVLARYLGFEGNIVLPAHEKILWDFAEKIVPEAGMSTMPVYTQALMDLGSAICTAKNPKCTSCPVQNNCSALAQEKVASLPFKQKTIKRTSHRLYLWWVTNHQDQVFWLQRPMKGIWAELYCLPVWESPTEADFLAQIPAAWHQQCEFLDPMQHVLTHKDLQLIFVKTSLTKANLSHWPTTLEGKWLAFNEWQNLGIPAPVRKIMQQLSNNKHLASDQLF